MGQRAEQEHKKGRYTLYSKLSEGTAGVGPDVTPEYFLLPDVGTASSQVSHLTARLCIACRRNAQEEQQQQGETNQWLL